jgi:hypothetical protein
MRAQLSRNWRLKAALAASVLAVLGYAWFASGVRTFTRPAEVLTFIPAFAVLLWTIAPLRRARQRRPSGSRAPYDPRGIAAWLVLLAAVVGWEMFQLFSKPRERHPTISSLLNSLISTHPSRFVGYLLWLFAGWLLLRDRLARRE